VEIEFPRSCGKRDGENETSKGKENPELVVGLQFQLGTYIVQYTVSSFHSPCGRSRATKDSLRSLECYTLNFQFRIDAIIQHCRFDR